MSRGTNVNLRHVRRAVKALGGRIVLLEHGGKHSKLTVQLADGRKTVLTLSKARIDPFKTMGWVRQELTAAGKQTLENAA